ncbi:hypothetical protein QR680_000787 [Steinernema hermaphroditum]|uniref:Uncharacterized protein n=1 Tax=Steinernema hermaphroditum TaxID=289476 RepID=A0AA39LET1_9BILA|nr:hypothetical protein QR680_000787 [Steinernema hermaphroditum]
MVLFFLHGDRRLLWCVPLLYYPLLVSISLSYAIFEWQRGETFSTLAGPGLHMVFVGCKLTNMHKKDKESGYLENLLFSMVFLPIVFQLVLLYVSGVCSYLTQYCVLKSLDITELTLCKEHVTCDRVFRGMATGFLVGASTTLSAVLTYLSNNVESTKERRVKYLLAFMPCLNVLLRAPIVWNVNIGLVYNDFKGFFCDVFVLALYTLLSSQLQECKSKEERLIKSEMLELEIVKRMQLTTATDLPKSSVMCNP